MDKLWKRIRNVFTGESESRIELLQDSLNEERKKNQDLHIELGRLLVNNPNQGKIVLGYSDMEDLWYKGDMRKYCFPIFPISKSEFELNCNRTTGYYTVAILDKLGYRCEILENLLKERV